MEGAKEGLIDIEMAGRENPLSEKFKQDTEAEFADWYPGMDMFLVTIAGLSETGLKSKISKFLKVILSILGIVETYSYMITLYSYFLDGNTLLYGILSAVSLAVFTLYVCFLTMRKGSYICNSPMAGLLLGLSLGLVQLGQPFILYDSLRGTSSIISEPSHLILQKMDIFKVGVFSLPQAVLQLYTLMQKYTDYETLPNVDTLRDWREVQNFISIAASFVTVAYTICGFYKTSKSGRIYSIVAFLYSLSSTICRILTYCCVAVVFKWVVFVQFGIGFLLRCWLSHPRPGDPYAGKGGHALSALLFSFIINIDPNVPYFPILLLADLETVVGIGCAIYLPREVNLSYFYSSNYVFQFYWRQVLAIAAASLAIMNITGVIVNVYISRLHNKNLSSICYRYGMDKDPSEIQYPQGAVPARLAHYKDQGCLLTEDSQRRYRFNPLPKDLVKYGSNYGRNVVNITKQWRVNPRCTEILHFRANELQKNKHLREAVADCTFGLNPYFGIQYQDVGLTLNRLFYPPKIMPNYKKQNGTEPMVLQFLITRMTCLNDLGDTRLAALDCRRLYFAAMIQGKQEIADMCLAVEENGKKLLSRDGDDIVVLI